MRRVLMLIIIISALAIPVSALDFQPPEPPSGASDLMPAERESFGEGLWEIIRSAVQKYQPELAKALGSCVALFGVILLTSFLDGLTFTGKNIVRLVSALAITSILFAQANAMVQLCSRTVQQLSEYGKLLLPVMTSALAAQGGATGATALYVGTVVFNTLLSSLISKILVPMVYLFLALSVANSATGDEFLKRMKDFMKWLMTWSLKILLYVFTGYLTITGVITGTADAAAVKAAKLTISGVVPVVGGILSDASETVIISAGVMKNAVGIYGLLAVAAIWISPFLQTGIQFITLKLTSAVSSVIGGKETCGLIEDFSSAMAILLGMTGTISFLLLISTVCFMKGMG